jgi:hypothetical protein
MSNVSCWHFENSVAFAPSFSNPPYGSSPAKMSWNLRAGGNAFGQPNHTLTANRLTGVSPVGYTTQSPWVVKNSSFATSLLGVPNIWTNSGSSGANLCYRQAPGGTTTSNVPLWPWPMSERIKQATAMAGAYSTRWIEGTGTSASNYYRWHCPTCSGSPIESAPKDEASCLALSGVGRSWDQAKRYCRVWGTLSGKVIPGVPPRPRPVWDVTGEMEAIFGPIPSQCRTTTSYSYPTPSTNLPGDLNADGFVNSQDLQLMVNVILGIETNSTIRSRADLNGDGVVNAQDLQRLVNIILG